VTDFLALKGGLYRIPRRGFPARTRRGDDVLLRWPDPDSFREFKPGETVRLPVRVTRVYRIERRSARFLWVRKLEAV
jgi:hypothetical protein